MGLVKKQVSEEDRRNFGIDLQSTENTDTGSKVQDPEKKKVILELRERKRKKVSWRYESFFLIYIYINIFHIVLIQSIVGNGKEMFVNLFSNAKT